MRIRALGMVIVCKLYVRGCLRTVKVVCCCCCRLTAAMATATYDVTGSMWGRHAKKGFDVREEASHRGLPDI
jgi:hypothetical protein